MGAFLRLSNIIDACTEWVGRWTSWLILAAVLISAVNAVVRKAFNVGSNAFLEIQWYLFAAVFLLAAGYTLLRNEHVRIDVILHRFSKRTQIIIEAVCIVLFLFPFCINVIMLVWPLVVQAYVTGEMSSNAGGLIRWPVYALVPLGMGLLLAQGVSEFIKRIAFLQGLIDDPTKRKVAKTAEEELAEFVRAKAEADEAAAAAALAAAAQGARK
ncbi:Sugar transporter [Rubrivivax sp. A210]|uniref:TRAP transporter small permease subunit n=1 Tax=Rubrivivax sp. A210 TaxID=2772301 RepID=UPI0019AC7267|nr:TRAP transporter small permease subunit [Rubrivivax sp. A210]CAD5374504.1 Sugar transporter [Rubrivivax sp. A210]